MQLHISIANKRWSSQAAHVGCHDVSVPECSAFFPLTDAAFASWPIPYFLGEPRHATTAPDALFGRALSCNRNAQVQFPPFEYTCSCSCVHRFVYCQQEVAALRVSAQHRKHYTLPYASEPACHHRHACKTPDVLSICCQDTRSALQGALLLPALRYAENGTFTINFWQRVHRRFPDTSQYMLSHQALLPANVNASAWGPDQVQVVEPLCAPISKLCCL